MPDFNGFFKLFSGTTDNKMSVSEARGGALLASIISLITASKVTRSRAENGKEPIAGLLF